MGRGSVVGGGFREGGFFTGLPRGMVVCLRWRPGGHWRGGRIRRPQLSTYLNRFLPTYYHPSSSPYLPIPWDVTVCLSAKVPYWAPLRLPYCTAPIPSILGSHESTPGGGQVARALGQAKYGAASHRYSRCSKEPRKHCLSCPPIGAGEGRGCEGGCRACSGSGKR